MSTTLRDCYYYGGKNGGSSKFCHFPPRSNSSSSSSMARRSRPWQQRKQPLQHRFKKKKKNFWRIPPRAPRNTTSFIMRSNRMGILAAMASPATPPLLLHTPIISPVPWPQESLGDGQSSNEFKVDAYGSMKGCIRLRPEAAVAAAEEEEQQQQGISCSENNKSADAAGGGDRRSCIDAVTSVQQLEERLDHGLLQKFEMINRDLSPWSASSSAKVHKDEEHANLCSARRMEDQETHIAYLEEENMSLQQRLLSMQHELHQLRRRLGSSVARDDPCYCSDESMGDGSCAS